MKSFTFALLLGFSCLLLQCGTDYYAEGEKAFQNQDYTNAIKNYEQALPEAENPQVINEKLALSYFYRGRDLFQKTRNIKAFTGNFEEAEQYIPHHPSEPFKKEYSRILFELGRAYAESKPRSDAEKDEYYNNSLSMLDEALYVDSTNTKADSLIEKIHFDNFQGLLDKANKFYERASRTGQVDLFLSSEYYLKIAAEYKHDDPGVISLFRKIKKKTLPVLNYRDGVSLAITAYSAEKDGMAMIMTIKNYLSKPVELNLNNFTMVAKDGNRYGVDHEALRVRKLFGENVLENTTLNSDQPLTEGIIVFAAPPESGVAYIIYQVDRRRQSRKYFP